MGVGSFAYGWLRENVLSTEIILPDGRLRTLEGTTSASWWERWGGLA